MVAVVVAVVVAAVEVVIVVVVLVVVLGVHIAADEPVNMPTFSFAVEPSQAAPHSVRLKDFAK